MPSTPNQPTLEKLDSSLNDPLMQLLPDLTDAQHIKLKQLIVDWHRKAIAVPSATTPNQPNGERKFKLCITNADGGDRFVDVSPSQSNDNELRDEVVNLLMEYKAANATGRVRVYNRIVTLIQESHEAGVKEATEAITMTLPGLVARISVIADATQDLTNYLEGIVDELKTTERKKDV